MLVRDDDLRDADRLAVLVLHRDLALGSRGPGTFSLPLCRASDSSLQDAMRVIERRRHEFRRLVAGIAEHDALVARAFILLLAGIDALRDVGRLAVQQDFDLGVLPVKAVLLIADILDRLRAPPLRSWPW